MMKLDKTVNLIGIYLMLWLVGLIATPLVVYKYGLESSLIRALVYVSCAGGLGGTVYLIRSFYKHIFEKNFRADSFWWYIFRPVISIIIGLMAYFLIVGGLLSLGTASNVNYQQSIMFYAGISFLAGFSFTQFSDKLEELAKTLFAKSGEKK